MRASTPATGQNGFKMAQGMRASHQEKDIEAGADKAPPKAPKNDTSFSTRRGFLAFMGAISMGAWGIPRRTSAGVLGNQSQVPSSDEMDEALEMLAPYGGSYRGGLSNHGPMTAEALISLGRQDVVIDWVESYRRRLELRPTARVRIEKTSWQESLGKSSRIRDWENWFSHQLAESPWQEVIGLWVPRLSPGMAAAGLHGVIRVGHAACSLAVKENAMRLDELARALGYWAAEYLPLPGQPAIPGDLAPSEAFLEVELLPREQRTGRGLISTELKDLRGFEPIEDVIDYVDPNAGSPSFMSDLIATFAGSFIKTNSNSFEFLHAVTGTAAIAELLPHVRAEQRATVQVYAWHAAAGILSRYGQASLRDELELEPSDQTVEQLTRLAVATGDEHTIKLAAACSREWQRSPDPRLLVATAKRIESRG